MDLVAKVNAVRDALRVIVNDTANHPTSLNYAVNYAKAGMHMTDPHELSVQCLYVLNNIAKWRHPAARDVREILRNFAKEHP